MNANRDGHPIAPSSRGAPTDRVVAYLRDAARAADPGVTIEQVANDVLGRWPDHALASMLGVVIRACGWSPERAGVDGDRRRIYRPIREPHPPERALEAVETPPLGPGWTDTFSSTSVPKRDEREARARPNPPKRRPATPRPDRGRGIDARIVAYLRALPGSARVKDIADELKIRRQTIIVRLHALRDRDVVAGPPWRLRESMPQADR